MTVLLGTTPDLLVKGVKSPDPPVLASVKGLLVSWDAQPNVSVWRLRYRPVGGIWQKIRVKGTSKLLCPLDEGVWQVRVAPLDGSWSPIVEMTI